MMLRLLLVLLLLCSPFLGEPAQAASPAVTRIEPRIERDRLLIDADVDFELNSQLRDAAQRGVPLYFTADAIITRNRWWWFDRTEVDTQMTWRIVYNALTRQWRVGVGELTLPVSSLDDAMDVMRRIRNWDVGSTEGLDVGTHYTGQMRLRLDTALLPRPFQVNALNNSSWTPATPWAEFEFSISSKQDAAQ